MASKLNTTNHHSGRRVGAALAVVSLAGASLFVGASAAMAATDGTSAAISGTHADTYNDPYYGDQTLTSTVTGLATADCTTGTGEVSLDFTSEAFKYRNGEEEMISYNLADTHFIVNGQDVLQNGGSSDSPTGSDSASFTVDPGENILKVMMSGDTAWTGTITCPIVFPDPAGTIVTLDSAVASGTATLSGTVDVNSLGADDTHGIGSADVTFSVSGPSTLTFPSQSVNLTNEGFASSTDVSAALPGTYTVTAQLVFEGSPLGESKTTSFVIPEPVTPGDDGDGDGGTVVTPPTNTTPDVVIPSGPDYELGDPPVDTTDNQQLDGGYFNTDDVYFAGSPMGTIAGVATIIVGFALIVGVVFVALRRRAQSIKG